MPRKSEGSIHNQAESKGSAAEALLWVDFPRALKAWLFKRSRVNAGHMDILFFLIQLSKKEEM
jgi:hypothetical protein